jgi:enoyl-CoA hydratase
MNSTVSYELNESVATITLDDGKVNVMAPAMQKNINEALDRAEKDQVKAVVIAGNGRVFSAGFDLAVFSSGDAQAALGMLAGGFELALRTLTFATPVIMAATGPAIAMGSFLLASGDIRIGSPRSRVQANEVAIGMSVPKAAVEIMRVRLTPPAFQRAVTLAATFAGDDAVNAGWYDEIVEPDQVLARAHEVAAGAAGLHTACHLSSKLKAHGPAVSAIRAAIDALSSEFGLG